MTEIDVCPECGSKNLVHESGCVVCMDCGWSPCIAILMSRRI